MLGKVFSMIQTSPDMDRRSFYTSLISYEQITYSTKNTQTILATLVQFVCQTTNRNVWKFVSATEKMSLRLFISQL